MTSLELDMILTLQWPGLVRRVMADANANDFAKGFARSISRHGKRSNWFPTPKQARLMRSLLEDYPPSKAAELVLIED